MPKQLHTFTGHQDKIRSTHSKMANWQIIPPQTKEHWEQLYDLRYRVLRQAWNQERGSEIAEDDNEALHAIVYTNNHKVIACCRAHLSAESQVQLRFMAVDPQFQGLGLGKAILFYIEKKATSQYHPVHQFVLHARENAIKFYQSNGYEIVSKSHLLFNSIQHYLMSKTLI